MGELRCLSPAVPVAAPRTLSFGFDFPGTYTERGSSRRIKFASSESLEIQVETSRNCVVRRRRSCPITSSAFWGLPVPADLKLEQRHFSVKCRSRAISKGQAAPSRGTVVLSFSDPELHSVLQLASDTELLDLSNILYGRSFLSPLLKSLTPGDGSRDDHYHDGQPPRTLAERDALRIRLEARFLFLAADAKATLSGRRPSYRDALLQVRKKLRIPCSASLSTEDIESEIFLHLLQQYSRKPSESPQTSPAAISKSPSPAEDSDSRKKKKKRWRIGGLPNVATLRGKELLSAVVKGGGAMTVSTLQRMAVRKLSGKVLLETARYQLAKEAVFKTGGQMAALLESRVAMLAAKQGLVGAAKRYVTMRSAMTILGPMLWGTLLADMLISAVGTDYARVVRAIYAFAQIRLLRSDSWRSASQYCG